MDRQALDLILAARDAAKAALLMATQLLDARGDHDEWRRMPAGVERCPISGWSRSTLYREAKAGRLRTKQINSCAFYSAADVRRLISLAKQS